jgi:hypothetical protein
LSNLGLSLAAERRLTVAYGLWHTWTIIAFPA